MRVWDIKYQLSNSGHSTSFYYGGNNNYQSKANFSSQLIGGQQFPEPILNVCWKGNSTNLFVSDVTGGIYNYDIQSNSINKLGAHSLGCKEIIYYENNGLNLLISGGWDGMLNFWDLRQPNPAFSINMNYKIYSMSMSFPLLVVGMDKQKIAYFNLNMLGNNFNKIAEFDSHLKHQTRVISTFPDACGYIIGSIEGRVAVKHVNLNKMPNIDKQTNLMHSDGDFAFRCHRSGNNNSNVYAVNTIAFNKVYHTFATGGGDGTFHLWDKSSKNKLKIGYHEDKSPITCLAYSEDGNLLAYSSGNDWSKGVFDNTQKPNRIGIHYLIDDEKKQKPPQKKY